MARAIAHADPFELAALSERVAFSASGRSWNTQAGRGVGGWLAAPNHSGGYHGLLQQWWDYYGLGSACLLVSEATQVGELLQHLRPATRFVTTDCFLDLSEVQKQTDVVWNLYEEVPQELAGRRFDSVVCQATMEHLADPVGVLRKLVSLLAVDGHLFVHTHTPLFPYHGWPRDYLRFFPDWFRDVPLVVPGVELVELYCVAGHAFAAYRRLVSHAS